jgi:uncharacterized protein GlcG (DUF336 family)
MRNMKKIMIALSLTLVAFIAAEAQSKSSKQMVATSVAAVAMFDAQSAAPERTDNSSSLSTSGSLNALPIVGQPTNAVQVRKLAPVTNETPDNKVQMPSSRSYPRKIHKSN